MTGDGKGEGEMSERKINHTIERPGGGANGILMLLLNLALLALSFWVFVRGAATDNSAFASIGVVLGFLVLLVFAGFYMVQPNQGVAITLFGDYRGTDRRTGLRWVLPWYG